ncbi:MAG: UDP-4-amino-4,6-dideoxy-N-acetyl-beta-L-altrosamine transaminase [Desulfomonile tiedjei]|nr:UDP-4-amino-4,6-dideoxy-N-acetyl-beta-L-altrosamine transaminase [Desulfomonile tiedjei]
MIPYGFQWIDKEEIDAVVGVLRSDRITQGPCIEEFERAVAEYTQALHAVAFSSGTAALHAACAAAGVGTGDEAITSPLSFIASANCAVYMGARPVFADIEPASLTLDWRKAAKKVTPRTKAVIPVDFGGQPCALDEITALARQHGLVVIEDAAHALGAEYKGRLVGSRADMTILSFHPVKHITTGEGGMVLTNDAALHEKLARFRTHGIAREPSKLTRPDEGAWYYEMQELGYNYRITDIQCALGLAQLKKLDLFVKRRREIAGQYALAFSSLPGLRLPQESAGTRSSYHLYVLQLPIDRLKGGRRAFFDALVEWKLGVNVHYIPIHLQPYYQRRFGYRRGDFPLAEGYYDRAITIPLYPKMTDEDVRYVIASVSDVFRQLWT